MRNPPSGGRGSLTALRPGSRVLRSAGLRSPAIPDIVGRLRATGLLPLLAPHATNLRRHLLRRDSHPLVGRDIMAHRLTELLGVADSSRKFHSCYW